MTQLIIVLTLIAGTIGTVVTFFQIEELGWSPFLATLVGTAVLSLLAKMYDLLTAIQAQSVNVVWLQQQIEEIKRRLP